MNPVNSPSKKRQSGRYSRAKAKSSGANANGASHGTPRLSSAGLGNVRTRSTAESSARAKLSRDSGGFFIHQIGHIGTADQRPTEHHFEPDAEAVIAIGIELRRRDVGRDRKIPSRGLKILTDSCNIHIVGAQVV